MLRIRKDLDVSKYTFSLDSNSDDYSIDNIMQYRNSVIKNEIVNQTNTQYYCDERNPYDCFTYYGNHRSNDNDNHSDCDANDLGISGYQRRCNEWAIKQVCNSKLHLSSSLSSSSLQSKETFVYTSYLNYDSNNNNNLMQDIIILDSILPDNFDYHVNLIVVSKELISLLSNCCHPSSTLSSSTLSLTSMTSLPSLAGQGQEVLCDDIRLKPYIKFLEMFTTTKNNFELNIYTSLGHYINDCIANTHNRCDLFVAIDYNDKIKNVYQQLLTCGMLCMEPNGTLVISSSQAVFNMFTVNDTINRQVLCDEVKKLLRDIKNINEQIRLETFETRTMTEGKFLDIINHNNKQYLICDKSLVKQGSDYFIVTTYKTQKCLDLTVVKEQKMVNFYSNIIIPASYKYLLPITWTRLLVNHYSYKVGKYLHLI